MGETSATGVAFTRNPSTGEKQLYGEFLINAQGEDVVAGIRTPQDITEAARMAARLRQAVDGRGDAGGLRRARRASTARSRSTTATCRTSSSPSSAASSGCCRPAPASAPPRRRCKIAVDMASEGLITQEEAVTPRRPGRARPAAASDASIPKAERKVHRDRACRPRRAPRRGEIVFTADEAETLKAQAGARSSWCASRPAPRTSTACTPPRAS